MRPVEVHRSVVNPTRTNTSDVFMADTLTRAHKHAHTRRHQTESVIINYDSHLYRNMPVCIPSGLSVARMIRERQHAEQVISSFSMLFRM